MRKFKKVFAVATATVMTLAMSVSAFASEITFHFQNTDNWETVGAWIYQGVGFDTNVTKAEITVNKSDGTVKQLWPGAKCVDEGNGWVKVSAEFTDSVATDGAVLIFNNFVGDAEVNQTTEEDDVAAIIASGIATTATAEKKQTSNIVLSKKNVFADGTVPSEIYITYDGKKTEALTSAPSSYGSATPAETPTTGSSETPTTGGSETPTTANNGTNTNNGSTDAAGANTNNSKGTTSDSNAPKTGDTVAVSVIVLAVAAAAVVVVSKKKENA